MLASNLRASRRLLHRHSKWLKSCIAVRRCVTHSPSVTCRTVEEAKSGSDTDTLYQCVIFLLKLVKLDRCG